MIEEPRSGCPINAAVEVLGDRWSLLVLRDIIFGNRRHFRELQSQSEEGIASNILADRLKKLTEAGLLTRSEARRGQRALYSLTEPAIQLIPVFAQLGSWGLRHRPTSHRLRVRAQLLEDGGPELWNEYMDELRARHLGARADPQSSVSARASEPMSSASPGARSPAPVSERASEPMSSASPGARSPAPVSARLQEAYLAAVGDETDEAPRLPSV